MSLKDITAYWKNWVSQADEGDQFCFLNADGEDDQGKGRGDDGDEDNNGNEDNNGDLEKSQSLPPDPFNIDNDIPYPFQCDTSEERTSCLQDLVPFTGKIHKRFCGLVKSVHSLEVSHILAI